MWEAIANAYNELGTVSGERMTESMFDKMFEKCGRTDRPLRYPELFCKAAIARHAVPAIRLTVRNMVDWAPGSMASDSDFRLFGHISKLLDALSGFYDNLFFNGLWLSRSAASEAAEHLQTVGLHHQALTSIFYGRWP